MFTIQHQSEDRVDYIPDFLNNRELAEQWAETGGAKRFFWVELEPLSGNDYQKASSQTLRRTRNDPDFMKGANRFVKRLISQYVPEVHNLAFARKNGTKAQPTTGAELYHEVSIGYPALQDLIDDIFAALKDTSRADEGDLKKLRQRCDGSTQLTTKSPQPETGDARDAIPATSQSQENQTKTTLAESATVMG